MTVVLAFGNNLFPIISPFTNSAFAQSAITPDNTLGSESSQVINNYLDNSTEALTGGATRGNNLFHSFQEFNVSQGRSALFLIPTSNIQNILVRVTGSNRSEILGRLRTPADSSANLFLINPNGIFFGPNARLSVNGSFVASTASGIKFDNDIVFSATAPQTVPLLTVNVPLGLQLSETPGEISVQGGFLRVQAGKTLALVGGNVNLDRGYLQAEHGQIALGGILGVGTIGLNLESNNQVLSFPNDVALADVSLSNQARVNANGSGGGYIQIQGKHITLNDGSIVAADTTGSENGRGISIQTEQLTIEDGSQVRASTRQGATGSGGDLVVKATGSVRVSGTDEDDNPSALFTETYGQGAAGNLSIETKQLIVENGGNIAASARENSQGFGGNLEVTADVIRLTGSGVAGFPSGLFAQTYGSNDAGSLTINTRQLIIQDGAQIVAGTQPSSQGNGGKLTVNASEFVELSGIAPNGQDSSGLFARSQGSGDAGSVYINTGKLIVRDQAQVTVSALGGGNAGNLEITAREILLDTKGQLFATTTSGDGGNINLQLENLLLLRNNSQIFTSASGGGNAGNITITIPDGSIVAVPEEDSDISADAEAGNGGKVNIDAFRVFGIQPREKRTELSDITASSESGPQGNIKITTSDLEPRAELINLLPNQPVEPKVSQVCQAGIAQKKNSFTITGRGGLPANPTETLNTDAVLTDWITLDKVGETSSGVIRERNSTHLSQTSIVEATGWVINAKGEVVLTANAPTGTIHNSWQKSTDCSLPQ
ncbi:filamentous hemagglutinin N-terminal domain-containing protein [Nostoc sp. UHCC 0702]|nr:filamentous hemagglutinin N-terminal domain-containing protein [Nostoc sp. UHCC 0702]